LSALTGAALTGLDATLGGASAADYQRQRDAANASPYLVAANGVTPSIATLIGGTPNPPVDRFADLFAAIDRRLPPATSAARPLGSKAEPRIERRPSGLVTRPLP
ncbi:MAG TPA: hypothetical protein VEI94_11455, partial [Candidatus Bathyarchaeia archaeon]|nr:hypothetical protein [Candidatus Bathyarchaeia archaeon]